MSLFVLGVLFGWLVEWLFFNFYWQPNHSDSDSSANGEIDVLKQQLADKNNEITTLKSEISAAIANVKPAVVSVSAKKVSPQKSVRNAAAAKKKAAANTPQSSSFEKEMQKISGIGPKLSNTLFAAGFESFESLANAKTDELKKAISSSGTKYAMVDVMTWPEQAGYLDRGDTAGFDKLLESLKK